MIWPSKFLTFCPIPSRPSIISLPTTNINIIITTQNSTNVKNSPRKTEEHLAKDTTVDKRQLGRILRAKAASSNGLETIGLYAAGVVAANAAKVPVETLNKLSLFYLGSRVVYNFVYVFLQDNRKFAPVRSFVWMAGLGGIFTLFIKAGNALY